MFRLKKKIPRAMWYRLKGVYQRCLEIQQPLLHQAAIEKIKKRKGKINCIFLAVSSPGWKYESLYRLMQKDSSFNPIILVCPQINLGRDHMLRELHQCFNHFNDGSHNVICSYDETSDKYVDLRSLDPHILFYTNPYEGLIDGRYYITKYRDILSCYVNYAYMAVEERFNNLLPLHMLVWKYFCEYDHSRQIKALHGHVIYKNRVVTGYPMYDEFVTPLYEDSAWKLDKSYKRIIYAPHHTIESTDIIHFSTFLENAEYMLKLRDDFADSVQFVFKPHPLLKTKLYRHPDWGKKRTDDYFNNWATARNSSVEEDNYIDLFKSSDAMIHDCGSFTTEYLYTKKPVMYLAGDSSRKNFNEEARRAFNCHYKYQDRNSIKQFIQEVVLDGKDPKKEQRETFYDNYLLPPNGCSVAENMLNEIKKSLDL